MTHNWLAIIPARGGSSGIKNKNLRILNGRPLLSYSFSFTESMGLSILFSTDSRDLTSLFENHFQVQINFAHMREDEIVQLRGDLFFHKRAACDADHLSTIDKVLFKIGGNLSIPANFEKFLLIQPTSPFRSESDIKELVAMSESREWTSIFSVRGVSGGHPNRMYHLSADGFGSHFAKEFSQDNIPRQLLPKLYIKDGAYYLFKRENLKEGLFIGAKPKLFVRSSWPFINLDTEDDMVLAELMMKVAKK